MISKILGILLLGINIIESNDNNDDYYTTSTTGQPGPLLLMAPQQIPLHQIESQVGTETMGDFECWLILEPADETVIMYLIGPENAWMGIGFGSTQMDGSLAYVYSMNQETNEFEIWEYSLGNHFIDQPRRQIKSYQVQTIDGYSTVMLSRPFNGNPGEYDFSIFDDNLQYIIAAGKSPVLSYHDMGYKANWIGLTTLPPPTTEPTKEPTLTPTVKPTDNPTVKPTLMPTETPTMKPSYNPTVSPTMKPSFDPTINPTVKPTTIAPTTVAPTTQEPTNQGIDSSIGGSIFNRDRADLTINNQLDGDRPELPQISIDDITNNNCALDVVFVVDTSKYGRNECIVQGNFVQNIMYGIIDRNSDINVAKFSLILFNGCSTNIVINKNDDWMSIIDTIDFCKNDDIIDNNECDQCLDGFTLGMTQFTRASSNKKVIVLMTNSECDIGLCEQWGLRNMRNTEAWIYSVGTNNDNTPLVNDLQCIADYIERFPNPWDAYSSEESEDMFLNNACSNNRRENIDRDRLDIDVTNRFIDNNNRDDTTFGDNSNRFGTDEERFGRDSDRFNTGFFMDNQNTDPANFWSGSRPNAGFFSRLENGGFMRPQIPNSFNGNQPQGSSNFGTPNRLAGDVNEKGTSIKGDNKYQQELREQAFKNQDHVLAKREKLINELGMPKGNMFNNGDNLKGDTSDLKSVNFKLQDELKSRAANAQDRVLNRADKIVFEKGLPEGFGDKMVTHDSDDDFKYDYSRNKYSASDEDHSIDYEDYRKAAFNRPYPDNYLNRGMHDYADRVYPEAYTRDTSKLISREYPKEYTRDYPEAYTRDYPEEYTRDYTDNYRKDFDFGKDRSSFGMNSKGKYTSQDMDSDY